MMKSPRYIAAALLALSLPAAALAAPPALRVCADPNNLPFSNAAGQGFENRLAHMLAAAMGARVEYTWWAQRRGFIRNTLAAGRCDLVMGVPAGSGPVLTTRPYYRSSYVFLFRRERAYALRSLDDPLLARLKIGVHLIGSDNPPPAMLLARRGIVDQVVGYSIYGDYREPNPPAALVEAVARGDVDVAIAWGPLAGYFAGRSDRPLAMVPVAQAAQGAQGAQPAPPDAPEDQAWPMQFSIAIGVRKNERALKERLDAVLQQKRPQIEALLREYRVPLVQDPLLAGLGKP